MDIELTNTLSGKKERFIPMVPGAVSMYNCGPTVYHSAHLGNLRAYVFADTLRKILEYNGLAVHQVINITDVGHLSGDGDEGEDKLEKGARREGKTAQEIARHYTDEFLSDLQKLNIDTRRIDFPKATEHIPEQISLIRQLEEKGYAYKTSDGMYFDTARFPTYGDLARLDTQHLREGARVEKNPEKRNPADFALWKFSSLKDMRQQEWDSPWGVGFPGWHIECSAMSMKYLGESFDIHTGGIDHIPVHHTNEIAQSEAVTGKQFVRTWMHSAFLTTDGNKMAKSDDNFTTLSSLEKEVPALAYRYFLYSGHYATPMHFSLEAVEGAWHALEKLRNLVAEWGEPAPTPDPTTVARFLGFINNDLDMPKALALLWETAKDPLLSPAVKKATLLNMDKVFSLNLNANDDIDIPADVLHLIAERAVARAEKKWGVADDIRAQIEQRGFSVKDTDAGQKVLKTQR